MAEKPPCLGDVGNDARALLETIQRRLGPDGVLRPPIKHIEANRPAKPDPESSVRSGGPLPLSWNVLGPKLGLLLELAWHFLGELGQEQRDGWTYLAKYTGNDPRELRQIYVDHWPDGPLAARYVPKGSPICTPARMDVAGLLTALHLLAAGNKSKQRRGRKARRRKRDKLGIVAAKIVRKGEADGFRPSWKELCNKYETELPRNTKPDTLRNRVNRMKQTNTRNNADDK